MSNNLLKSIDGEIFYSTRKIAHVNLEKNGLASCEECAPDRPSCCVYCSSEYAEKETGCPKQPVYNNGKISYLIIYLNFLRNIKRRGDGKGRTD